MGSYSGLEPANDSSELFDMDIKGFRKPIGLEGVDPLRSAEATKTAASADRDPNHQPGEQPAQQQEWEMTDEEFNHTVEWLKTSPGIKDSHLEIKLDFVGAQKIVMIIDPKGEVIRRLTEADLCHFFLNKEKRSGHLFSKTG